MWKVKITYCVKWTPMQWTHSVNAEQNQLILSSSIQTNVSLTDGQIQKYQNSQRNHGHHHQDHWVRANKRRRLSLQPRIVLERYLAALWEERRAKGTPTTTTNHHYYHHHYQPYPPPPLPPLPGAIISSSMSMTMMMIVIIISSSISMSRMIIIMTMKETISISIQRCSC